MKRLLLLVPSLFVAWHAFASAQESEVDTLGVMYWTDRTAGNYRAVRDGSEIQLIVPRPFTNSIAVDPEGGRLYWATKTDRGLEHIELWQGKLDGSLPTLLATDLNWVADVMFDPVDKKVYVSSLYSSLEILPPADE